MGRPSTIDRLPAEQRELIKRLRDSGRTIDEIVAALRALRAVVSRSAVARHVQELDYGRDAVRSMLKALRKP